jgi:hypothetical protein
MLQNAVDSALLKRTATWSFNDMSRRRKAVLAEADWLCGGAGSSQTNRKPHVKFHAPQQEHTFGFPYQVYSIAALLFRLFPHIRSARLWTGHGTAGDGCCSFLTARCRAHNTPATRIAAGAPGQRGQAARRNARQHPGARPPSCWAAFMVDTQLTIFGVPACGRASCACYTDSVRLPAQLLPGDVLIMGSDGLWDNVDDNEILDLVLTVRLEVYCDSVPFRTWTAIRPLLTASLSAQRLLCLDAHSV